MAFWKDPSQSGKDAAKNAVKDPVRDAPKGVQRDIAVDAPVAFNAPFAVAVPVAVDASVEVMDASVETEPAASADIFTAPAITTIDTSTLPLPTPPIQERTKPMTASITPIRDIGQNRKESVLTEELSIEGKIEGSGNVRIAGKFKGDVNVQGNLVIEQGAMVTGSVRALTITIAGQLEGNIDAATRVELLESGVLTGDVTAESLTVAAGSRMRGKAEFGWTDKPTDKLTRKP